MILKRYSKIIKKTSLKNDPKVLFKIIYDFFWSKNNCNELQFVFCD